MHQYCNVLSFLVSRQKLGPDGRSEWLWAAPTGAHSQPAACVQRGQVPQAARARAPPTCAHGRTALPAQAGRHCPRYQLRDPPCTSSLASTPWLAWGLGRGGKQKGEVIASQLQADGALWAPHLILLYSFRSRLRKIGECVHFSGTPHSSWSPGFSRPNISAPRNYFSSSIEASKPVRDCCSSSDVLRCPCLNYRNEKSSL